MTTKDFTTTILVDQTPNEAFDAINNVTGWWTENLEGGTEKLNDEFSVRFGDVHYSKQKLIEVIPGKKVVWLITDSKLTFVKDQTEWTGTKIVFDIIKKDGKTQVTFTQHGLVPAFECYGGCSGAWTDYIQNSLYGLITTGKGKPTLKVS
ncbi:MAG: SRPBCC domain-containing protein [Mucilaginibacter sp.]|nr:SRPBCC domain-containing protein [Mucilaginibacter sp.]